MFSPQSSNGSASLSPTFNITQMQKKLQYLTGNKGYDLTHVNGQRIYEPKSSLNIPPPPRGCEVFIGNIQKHIYEDVLIPLFQTVAPLYKFRLMLEFSEKSRGFAFATYFHPDDADRAVEKLDKFKIYGNHPIAVYKSLDNCRLYMGNIPKDKSRNEIMQYLNKLVDGVKEIITMDDLEQPGLHRGYIFVEFETHRFAAMARKQFAPNHLVMWNQNIPVDWANPLLEIPNKLMATVTALYLSNLPLHINADDLTTIISDEIGSEGIIRVYKKNHFAFVHMTNKLEAEWARQLLTGLRIDNQVIKIEWARPKRFSYKNLIPQNLCKSVPLKMRKLVYKERCKVINNN